MSSEETSKNGKTEKKAPLPLKVTIEDPNTGDLLEIRARFFIGLYTRKDENTPDDLVGIGQVIKGSANALELIAVVKAIQEKLTPTLLDRIDSCIDKLKDSKEFPSNRLETLLSILMSGSLFLDD